MNVQDVLDRLPFELAHRLESDPFFQDIPIVVAVKGNVAREFQQKQAVITEKCGKRGAAVFVLQMLANDEYKGLPGGPMKLKPSLQVMENVELNYDDRGTGKSVRKIARHIILNLKLAGFRGLVTNLQCDDPAIEPVPLGEEFGDESVSEKVNLICQEFSDQQLDWCLPPTCSQVEGTLTVALATATGGAQVWYTTDDSYPFPGASNIFPRSTSQLYAAPIAVPLNTPVIIRACSYLNKYTGSATDYIASSVERFTLILTND